MKIPLCQVDLAQTINEWKDVQSCKEDDEYLGDMCFSLRSLCVQYKPFIGLQGKYRFRVDL